MLVHRHIIQVKPGRGPEVIEMLKAEDERTGYTDKTRIYTSNIGPVHTMIYEIEFENLSELEESWTEWWSLPETPAFMEKWNELIETGGSSETWTLVE